MPPIAALGAICGTSEGKRDRLAKPRLWRLSFWSYFRDSPFHLSGLFPAAAPDSCFPGVRPIIPVHGL